MNQTQTGRCVTNWQIFWIVAPKVVVITLPLILGAAALDHLIHKRAKKRRSPDKHVAGEAE
jgi:hypothetical protein